MNIIDQLKKNERPFGLMSEEMQAAAKDISIVKFDYYNGQNDGAWDVDSKDDFFRHYRTYRLRPDYTEEPEIVECEIYTEGKEFYFEDEGSSVPIWSACSSRHFIGFKFEDGSWYGAVIKPVNSSGEPLSWVDITIDDIASGRVTILHATHVLFRRQT